MAIIAGSLLAFSILLGGAAPPRPAPLAILEILGLVTVALAVLRLGGEGDWRRHGLALGLAAAVLAVPLLQLIPLPADLWVRLPGREQAALGPALAGAAQGWTAISLSPDRTWSTALGLIPAVGVFVACLVLNAEQRFLLVAILLIGAAVSVLVGALQLASGGAVNLHANTPDGMVSGFFVNRNHLAALLLMSLPFAAALAVPSRRWPVAPRTLRWLTALFGLLVVVALGAVRSRAGIILLAPATVLALAIILKSGDAIQSMRALRLWMLGGLTAGVAVVAFGLSPIMARFDEAGGAGRFERWPDVLQAAGQYQPVGAGLGAFDAVYRSVEPVEQLGPTYFNHAHNDYLELWLETGWLGIGVLILISIWAGSRWLAAWRESEDRRPDPLARAGGAALILLALHSVVDFPVRTTTVLVIAALCLGLIAAGAAERPRTAKAVVRV